MRKRNHLFRFVSDLSNLHHFRYAVVDHVARYAVAFLGLLAEEVKEILLPLVGEVRVPEEGLEAGAGKEKE